MDGQRKKVLWVGDAACPSGFAQATHKALEGIVGDFDVVVLGLNYNGDPQFRADGSRKWPYDIWTCFPGGDVFGYGRLLFMCDLHKPDVVVIQNDPWNIPLYTRSLRNTEEYKNIPVVAIVPVDGKNCAAQALKDVDHAIFWTQFGLDEARDGGYVGPATVIPLGIDLDVFKPLDKAECRSRTLPPAFDEKFIVGCVGRNQPRKRIDLTLAYFAEWVKTRKVVDACLMIHVAPTGDRNTINIKQLAAYYGIYDRLILVEPEVFYGIDESIMVDLYNCMDVAMTTTQGEGWGLTSMEAMACGVPLIAPEWSALGEWAKDYAWLVPCSSTIVGEPWVNVVGGIADRTRFIEALHRLYISPETRANNRQAGLECAAKPKYRWPNIASRINQVIKDTLVAVTTR